MKDILKLVAHFKVYGMNLYGVYHSNLDTGKGNVEQNLGRLHGWSNAKIKRVASILIKEGILNKAPAEPGMKFYSLSTLHKTQLKYIELN